MPSATGLRLRAAAEMLKSFLFVLFLLLWLALVFSAQIYSIHPGKSARKTQRRKVCMGVLPCAAALLDHNVKDCVYFDTVGALT